MAPPTLTEITQTPTTTTTPLPSCTPPPPTKPRSHLRSRLRPRPLPRGLLIPGYPPPTQPLPAGLDHESIIKHYPNHLRGALLLEISATWTPKEISTTSGTGSGSASTSASASAGGGGGLLKANTIVKRIKAAKIAAGQLHHKPSISASTSASRSRRAKKPPVPPPSSSSISPPFCPPEFESPASSNFLSEQLSLRRILEQLDPTWSERQSGMRKKKPGWDRGLLERAVEIREGEKRDERRHDG